VSTLVWGGHSCRSPLTLKGHAFQACRNLSQSASASAAALGGAALFAIRRPFFQKKDLTPAPLHPML